MFKDTCVNKSCLILLGASSATHHNIPNARRPSCQSPIMLALKCPCTFLCRCTSLVLDIRHQTIKDIRTCNVVADSLYSEMNSCSRFVDTDCCRLFEALLAGLARSELEQDLHPVILNILAPTTMSKSLRHSIYWVVVL